MREDERIAYLGPIAPYRNILLYIEDTWSLVLGCSGATGTHYNCTRNKIAESICRPGFDQAEKQTDMEEFSSWGNLLFKIRNKHGRKLEPRSRACCCE